MSLPIQTEQHIHHLCSWENQFQHPVPNFHVQYIQILSLLHAGNQNMTSRQHWNAIKKKITKLLHVRFFFNLKLRNIKKKNNKVTDGPTHTFDTFI